jgi:hypothetical protein
MPNEVAVNDGLCDEVQMTPMQCNEVIEDNLTHLMPVMESALSSMERVNASLENGGVSWRRALQRARERMEKSASK